MTLFHWSAILSGAFVLGGLINPWTGEDMSAVISGEEQDESSGHGGEYTLGLQLNIVVVLC